MSVGNNAAACCCQPGSGAAIVIKVMAEAAVNRMWGQAFMGFYSAANERGNCQPPCQDISLAPFNTELEWSCGVVYYLGDSIPNPQQIKMPLSHTIKPCGCSTSFSCGNPPQAVNQYTGHACVYPGERVYGGLDIEGSANCGCYTINCDGTPACCFDINAACTGVNNLGDAIAVTCNVQCTNIAYEIIEGPRLWSYYTGSWGYKLKGYVKREGEFRFDWLKAETFNEERLLNFNSTALFCSGATNQFFQAKWTFDVDVYAAPIGGFSSKRTKHGTCRTFICWDQVESPYPNGIDSFSACEADGRQAIRYYNQPKWTYDYGFRLIRTSTATSTSGYSASCDGTTLTIHRLVSGSQTVVGTISLTNVALPSVTSQVNTLTSGRIKVQAPYGLQAGMVSLEPMCVGPVQAFPRTDITTASVTSLTGAVRVVKIGYAKGDAVPTSAPFGIYAKYDACLYAKDAPTVGYTDCSEGPPGGGIWGEIPDPPPMSGPYEFPGTDVMTPEQFAQGFAAIDPNPEGCFQLNESCPPALCSCTIPFFPSIYRPFVNLVDNMIEPFVNFDNGTGQWDFRLRCVPNDASCELVTPYAGATPNDAWAITCPWNGTVADKAKVKPLGTTAVTELIYEDLGCCESRPGGGGGKCLDCTSNMQYVGQCCQPDAACPTCAQCSVDGPTCFDFGRDIGDPCYNITDACGCCCSPNYLPWWRQMRSSNHGCGMAVKKGFRMSWTLTRTTS